MIDYQAARIISLTCRLVIAPPSLVAPPSCRSFAVGAYGIRPLGRGSPPWLPCSGGFIPPLTCPAGRLALLDFHRSQRENAPMPDPSFQPGQMVRVNLAGIQVQGVLFHAAVTDAVGHIVRQTSDSPPKFLVKLLFSFRGVSEVEVPADRIRPA